MSISTQPLGIIVLAAGKGSRMKSDLPKVLHPAGGQSMLSHVLQTAKKLQPEILCVVVGYGAELVKKAFEEDSTIFWAEQKQLLGTGHAIQATKEIFDGFKGNLLVLYGDVPLILPESLKKMMEVHTQNKADVTLMTAILTNPTGYGRIIQNKEGDICAIVEEKDASMSQRQIQEINTGMGIFDAGFLMTAVFELQNKNQQKEYYLTDVVQMAAKAGRQVSRFVLSDPTEAFGVNDLEALKKVEELLKSR